MQPCMQACLHGVAPGQTWHNNRHSVEILFSVVLYSSMSVDLPGRPIHVVGLASLELRLMIDTTGYLQYT